MPSSMKWAQRDTPYDSYLLLGFHVCWALGMLVFTQLSKVDVTIPSMAGKSAARGEMVTQSDPASEWQSWDLNPGTMFLITCQASHLD